MDLAGRRRAGRASGFSLLEILMVMAILAIVSLLAAGTMSGGMSGMQLRSSAREIAAQLRFTRAQAIATGQPQRFTIDPHAHTWTAPNARHGEIPKRLGIVFTGAREAQERAGEGAIMFFADGASTGGRIRLEIDKAAWDVNVKWLTGEVGLRRGAESP